MTGNALLSLKNVNVGYKTLTGTVYAANPQHPYTKVLISNFPSLDFDKQTKPISIHGEPPTPINPGPGCYFAPRCYMATERCFRDYPSAVEGESGHTVCCHCAANV